MKNRSALACLMAALLLAGCAITPLPRTEGAIAPLNPDEAQRSGKDGTRVRWGGLIIQTAPGPAQTCFEISSRPLDREGEPLQTDETFGRFMACAKGYYEPSVYSVARKLTVVGELAPIVTGKVGEHEYRFPMVKIEALHLWPVALPASPPVLIYDPFWDFRYPLRYPVRNPTRYPFPYLPSFPVPFR